MSEHGRTFRMGVFNAIDALWQIRQDHLGVPVPKLATALQKGRAETAGFDYASALQLLERVPSLLAVNSAERSLRLREYLSRLLSELRPGWRHLLIGGRQVVAQHADADVLQVFRASGLFDSVNDEAVRAWWDAIACGLRLAQDEARLAQGREAELKTLQRERQRLIDAGRPDLEPQWCGFEDCTLGYDVRSFTVNGASERAKYIEVKSTASGILRFFLSRNEWEVADRHRHDYCVHLWDEATDTVTEIDFSTLASHIPQDRGHGAWVTVQVLMP